MLGRFRLLGLEDDGSGCGGFCIVVGVADPGASWGLVFADMHFIPDLVKAGEGKGEKDVFAGPGPFELDGCCASDCVRIGARAGLVKVAGFGTSSASRLSLSMES
jgi:hypothetical protein